MRPARWRWEAHRHETSVKPLKSVAACLLLFGALACGRAQTSQAEALKAAIEASGGNAGLSRFYAANEWDIAWSENDTKALEQALADRTRHGLDHVEFFKPPAAGASVTEQDVARTAAALAYAGALSRGYVDPQSIHRIYTVPRPQPDLASGLFEALRDDRVDEWLEELAPQDDAYRTLSEAYETYRKAAAQETTAPTSDSGGLIRVGDDDPRVPEIARQLAASGYLPEYVASQQASAQYTPALAAALKQLQRDYGIAGDGVIGPATRAVLNMGAAARARTTAVAMERLRWLTREPPSTRIDVNVAAAEMTYWRDSRPADRRNVIVGRPGDETPQLQAPLFRLVANPTWTVPRSIQSTELADKGDAYLRANGMAWRESWIVQQPGPKNALGLVKFDMLNDYAIYLHDTPAKSLFSRSQRQLSHGCVRVLDALGFADMIAREEGVADEWQRARQTGEEQFVKLPREIPVRLLYQTAFVGPDGQVQLHADPYGWDTAVAEGLGFAQQGGSRLRSDADDIGP